MTRIKAMSVDAEGKHDEEEALGGAAAQAIAHSVVQLYPDESVEEPKNLLNIRLFGKVC